MHNYVAAKKSLKIQYHNSIFLALEIKLLSKNFFLIFYNEKYEVKFWFLPIKKSLMSRTILFKPQILFYFTLKQERKMILLESNLIKYFLHIEIEIEFLTHVINFYGM